MMWDQFKPYLLLAVNEHPCESMEDLTGLREDVAEGRAMLVGMYSGAQMVAAGVVELVELSDGRSLHVRYLGGNGMDEWIDELHARLKDVAQEYGCRWISLTGRMGWRKVLKRLDYNPVAIQLRAEV